MKEMKKNLLITTLLAAGTVLTANAFAADDLDGLFGEIDGWTNTSTTTGSTTNSNNNDDLFGDSGTTNNKDNNTSTDTQNQDNTNKTEEVKLEELKYYIWDDSVSFISDYLPSKSNFVVEFTGNRTSPIVLTNVAVQDLSGKVIDLGGLAEKISFITAGNDIKKITFAELNQLAKKKNNEGFTINPKDKVYIQGEFNNIDKQVLATLLNNQTKFKIIVKGKNIKELIPTKEGTMTNNTTLTVGYLFKYVLGENEQPQQEEMKDKTIEKVKKKDTGPVETSLAFLLFVMVIMSYIYVKNGNKAGE